MDLWTWGRGLIYLFSLRQAWRSRVKWLRSPKGNLRFPNEMCDSMAVIEELSNLCHQTSNELRKRTTKSMDDASARFKQITKLCQVGMEGLAIGKECVEHSYDEVGILNSRQ